VLLPQASELETVNKEFKNILTEDVIENIVAAVPEEWLKNETVFSSVEEHRKAYVEFLVRRMNHSEIFVNEAKHAREAII